MAATVVGVIALLAGGGGCELAVSDSLPSFTCVPGADTCQSGYVCVPATHQCVPRSGTCTPGAGNACGGGMRCDAQTLRCLKAPEPDASGAADAMSVLARDSTPDSSDVVVGDGLPEDGQTGDAPETNVPDVTDGPPPCHGDIGCGCSGASDCNTTICGDRLTLTPALYSVVGMMDVCTKPCCTSADCPSGTVCFGTGGGGNYCVLPKWIGRNSSVGGAQGGAACSLNAECRSGLCNMGTCADTCCSTAQQAAECASGSFCRFAQFPGNSFDTHVTAWCGPNIGNTASGMTCAVDIACQSGKCNVTTCQAACRNASDCGTGFACSYGLAPALPTNKDIIEGCMRAPSGMPNGGTCTSNSDCQSAFCDTSMQHCTDACATDTDCKAGMHCTPVEVTVQGSYSVLACE